MAGYLDKRTKSMSTDDIVQISVDEHCEEDSETIEINFLCPENSQCSHRSQDVMGAMARRWL